MASEPRPEPRQYELFDAPAPPSGARPPAERAAPPEACYWDHCPNCGSRLRNQGCRYRCPRCHYFMSCSDFD